MRSRHLQDIGRPLCWTEHLSTRILFAPNRFGTKEALPVGPFRKETKMLEKSRGKCFSLGNSCTVLPKESFEILQK